MPHAATADDFLLQLVLEEGMVTDEQVEDVKRSLDAESDQDAGLSVYQYLV